MCKVIYRNFQKNGKYFSFSPDYFFLNPIPPENLQRIRRVQGSFNSFEKTLKYSLTWGNTCVILIQEKAICPNQQEIQPTKIMFNSEDPESYVNGKESLAPEMAGVNSTDDGYSCGNENDSLMALLAEFGY